MRTLTNGGLSVVCPDKNVYCKEANILQVTANIADPNFDNIVTLTINEDVVYIGGVTADYALSNNEVDIDIQDIINVVKDSGEAGASVTLSTVTGESVKIDFVIAGYARPFVVPKHPLINDEVERAIEAGTGVGGVVLPPAYILAPLAGLQALAPVCYKTISDNVADSSGIYNTVGTEVRATARINSGNYMNYYFLSANLDGVTKQRLTIITKPLLNDTCAGAGVRYCMLKWQDRLTGLAKQFTFEVEKLQYTTGEIVALMQLNKEYESRKGEIGGFVARLRGLSVYDYLYYSDIINSDSVEATLDGVNWKKVYINTNSAQALSGNADTQDLEINVIYVRNEY